MTPNRSHSANSLQFEGNIIEIDCLEVGERPARNLDRFSGLTLMPPRGSYVYGMVPMDLLPYIKFELEQKKISAREARI